MIVVLGAEGMLGSSLRAQLSIRQVSHILTTHKSLDLTNNIGVRKFFEKVKPSIVINAAAFTDVDKCESQSEVANLINGDGVRFLGQTCKAYGAKLIHISTDYVFDGEKEDPYIEEDKPSPIQEYGKSKLNGEMGLLGTPSIILRVQWLFGKTRFNFIDWVTQSVIDKKVIEVTHSQTGSPCSTDWLAFVIIEMVCRMMAKGLSFIPNGTYHLTHDDFATRCEVADFIVNGISYEYQWLVHGVDDLKFGKARRPKNTSMSPLKIKELLKLGSMGSWQDDVKFYIRNKFNMELYNGVSQ